MTKILVTMLGRQKIIRDISMHYSLFFFFDRSIYYIQVLNKINGYIFLFQFTSFIYYHSDFPRANVQVTAVILHHLYYIKMQEK